MLAWRSAPSRRGRPDRRDYAQRLHGAARLRDGARDLNDDVLGELSFAVLLAEITEIRTRSRHRRCCRRSPEDLRRGP